MYDFAGKTVLVTGGSMGIGEVFARELARRGAHLVLVARSEAKLRALAAELGQAHGVRVEALAEDLAKPGAARRVVDAVHARGLAVDVLVNNAGFGMFGPFEDVAVEVQRGQIDVNVGVLVELAHGFMAGIVERKGGVINIASVAAFTPVPYFAVYGASKAFVLSFSEALRGEYAPRGVRVVALCPGPTETPFFARAGEAASLGNSRAKAEDVVRVGLAAFDANRSYVVPGAKSYVMASASRWFPRQLTARVAAWITRPKETAITTTSTPR